MAQPILTFTGNPLAETTFDCLDWRPGGTFRAQGASFQVGGKGINVSKMLRRLGSPSTAITFLGGDSGTQCLHWLTRKGIPFFAAPTTRPTRTGLVVRSDDLPETTFLGPDAPPDAPAWQVAADQLRAFSPMAGAIAVCGSAPGWSSDEATPFRKALDAFIDGGKPVFIDSYGPPLRYLVESPVALVKINATELQSLLADKATEDTQANLKKALNAYPVQRWIITDGANPLWMADGDGSLERFEPTPAVEISPTGCGDVLLACLLHARQSLELPWPEALRFALPYAAANAAHPGVADFDYPGLLPNLD